MNNVTFDAHVAELERSYADRYQGLVWSTFRLMLLGYAVLLLSMVAFLAIILLLGWLLITAPNAITIKIALVVGVVVVPVLFHLLSSLWVKTHAPEGIELKPQDAPELFAELAHIAAHSRQIHFSKVLVNGEFNACVVNTPRLGLFGWSKHHLVIGLPLMAAISREEFVSILAHEYAHFSHAHGKLGNVIYRARTTWMKMSECIFSQDSIFVKPLQSFLGWFWPRLNAKSFVVSRMNEYQADAFAASMSSPTTAARALARVHVQGVRVERGFWGKLSLRAVEEAQAPRDIMGELQQWLSEPSNDESALLRENYLALTDSADTHPCLRDRVAAIMGKQADEVEIPDSLEPLQTSAAEAMFPAPLLASLRQKLSAKWLADVEAHWRVRHEESKTALKEIAELDDSKVGRWRSIELRSDLYGLESVATDLAAFVCAYPDHKNARFLHARNLLDKLDPRGESLMVAMKEYNPHVATAAVSLLSDYYQRTGNRQRVRQVAADYDELSRNFQFVEAERGMADIDDQFRAHELATEDLESLLNYLRGKEVVKQLYVVKKVCRHYPEWPHYYLLVRIKFPVLSLETDQAKAQLNQEILNAASFDGSLLLHNIDHAPHVCVKKIVAMPSALVYQREGYR